MTYGKYFSSASNALAAHLDALGSIPGDATHHVFGLHDVSFFDDFCKAIAMLKPVPRPPLRALAAPSEGAFVSP